MTPHSLQVSAVVRLFLALWLAITPTFVWAGSMTLLGVGGPAAATGCTAATNFLARTSGLSGTETTAYTNMICGLVTDGIITGTLSGAAGCGSHLDAFYIFATNTTTTALLNLCGTSFGLVSHGSMTFSADHGYAGDASTGFLDSQFTPSTAGGNWGINSASQGTYVLTNRTTTANKAQSGAAVGSGGFTLIMVYDVNGNVQYGSNGTNGSSVVANAAATSKGFWVQSRTASNSNSVYRNGNTTALQTDATAPSGNTDSNLYLFAINNLGSIFLPTDDQMSAAFFGGGLTNTQMNQMSNRINAFMTALGINVY